MDNTNAMKAAKLSVNTFGLMNLLEQGAKEGFACEKERTEGCGGCDHFAKCGELQDIVTILYGKGERTTGIKKADYEVVTQSQQGEKVDAEAMAKQIAAAVQTKLSELQL